MKLGRNSVPVVNEVRLRVRYAETDQMGVAYHSNHFIWFEVGRVELLRQLGFSYKDMEQNDNCHMPVVDARCRYRAPAVYDEEVIVRTHLKNVRESLAHFAYELLRANDGTLLATGETMHMAIDSEKKKTVFPQKYMRALRAATGK
ncbi:MAG: thioesterase family protein [Terriglobales bacterium]